MSQVPELRLVLPSLGGGGSERVATRLCEIWSKQGRRLEIIVVRGNGVFESCVPSMVAITRLQCSRTSRAGFQMARAINRHPDVPILCFGFDIGILLVGLKRLRLISPRLIYREGSIPESNVPASRRWMYRLMFAKADATIAQTDFAASCLARLGIPDQKIFVCPNPLLQLGPELPVVPRAIDTYPILLAIGRLSAEKGFDRLIHAMPAILKVYPQARLKIIGDGPLRASLVNLIKSYGLPGIVTLPGFSTDVGAEIRACDIVVSSSHYEGLPNSTMEAIAAGVRVVVSDAGGGVRELMTKCGLEDYVVPGDSFCDRLPDDIRKALNSGPQPWADACARIRAFADPAWVSACYWSACVPDTCSA